MVIAAIILNFGMSIYTTFIMLTIDLSTLQLKRCHLKHVLAIFPNLLYILSLGRILLLMVNMTLIGKKSSLNKFSRYIKWCKSSWKGFKPSTRQDMTSIVLIIVSRLEKKFGFTLVRRDLKEKVKN
jgi:hypothetical protein